MWRERGGGTRGGQGTVEKRDPLLFESTCAPDRQSRSFLRPAAVQRDSMQALEHQSLSLWPATPPESPHGDIYPDEHDDPIHPVPFARPGLAARYRAWGEQPRVIVTRTDCERPLFKILTRLFTRDWQNEFHVQNLVCGALLVRLCTTDLDKIVSTWYGPDMVHWRRVAICEILKFGTRFFAK